MARLAGQVYQLKLDGGSVTFRRDCKGSSDVPRIVREMMMAELRKKGVKPCVDCGSVKLDIEQNYATLNFHAMATCANDSRRTNAVMTCLDNVVLRFDGDEWRELTNSRIGMNDISMIAEDELMRRAASMAPAPLMDKFVQDMALRDAEARRSRDVPQTATGEGW